MTAPARVVTATRRPVVGVNLLWLIPGVVGGSEESTTEVVRALLDLDATPFQLHIFARADLFDAHPDLARAAADTLPVLPRGRPLRIAAEATWLAARARRRRVDLLHHAGGTAPPGARHPYVLTIHDLQPLERASGRAAAGTTATHSAPKRAYLAATVPRSARRARLVVVPSEFVRQQALAMLGLEADRVRVVPHAPRRLPAADPDDVRRRYRLDGPVVLYPAITYPHKNHEVLVRAFARLTAAHPDAVLVLPGGRGGAEEAVERLVGELGLADRVRRPGRVPEADLGALYRLAAVVAVPSRHEGYGLPAAEAMVHGAPLVAADATALPEVVGDAGILVAPDAVDAWVGALACVLGDPAERDRLSAAGRARAAGSTWAAAAAALAEVYREALDR